MKLLRRLTRLTLVLIILSWTLTGCLQETVPEQTQGPGALDSNSDCGGNVYYQNFVDLIDGQIIFSNSAGELNIAQPDGSDQATLLDIAGTNFAFDGQTLFFTQGSSSGELMKINLDGTNGVRIGFTALKNLVVLDQTLYAIEAEQSTAISLKQDGTGRRVIVETPAASMLIHAGKILIIGVSDDSGLVRYDPVSGKSELLLSQRISSPNVCGDWLYYANPNDSNRLYAWSFETGISTKISSFGIDKPFIVSEGIIYFIDSTDNSRLYSHPLEQAQTINLTDSRMVIDDAVGNYVVCEDFIYYQRPEDKRIYRVDTDGSAPIRIN